MNKMRRTMGLGRRLTVAAAAVAACLLASGQALAHSHGNVQFGFSFGIPGPGYYGSGYYGPGYYYPPYPRYYYPPAYYPPVVAVPASPPVYIEQGSPAPSPRPEDYWYYCGDTRAYYPYVKECPGGWQRVAPDLAPR